MCYLEFQTKLISQTIAWKQKAKKSNLKISSG